MAIKIFKNRMVLLGLMCSALVVCSVAFYQIQVEAEEFGGRKGGKHGGPHHMHGGPDMPGPPHHRQGPPPMEDTEFPKLMMFLIHDGEKFAALDGEHGPEGRPERGPRKGHGRRGPGPDAEEGPHGEKGPGGFGRHERGPGKGRGHDKGPGPGEGRGPHRGFGMKGPGPGGPFGMRGPGGPFGMRGHGPHGKPDPEIKKLMMGNMGRMMALRAEIDLTEEQRETLRELMKERCPQMHEKMGDVMEARKELMGQITLGEATEESISSSASKIADAIAAAALQAKSVRDEAMAVFTEDQQSLIQEVLVKNMAARKEIHEKMKVKMEEHKAKKEERKKEWEAKKLKKEEEGNAEDDK